MDRSRQRPTEAGDGQARPAQAHLSAISGVTEGAIATDFGGGRAIQLTHPAMGIRAWIRFMPEEGSSAVLTQRADTAAPEVLYYSGSKSATKVDAYLRGVGHYRPMNLGEAEVSSSGFAQTYWTKQGALRLRGGIITGWLAQDELEVGFRAPIHRRLLHDYAHESPLVAEERFGIVWRKGDDHTKRTYIKRDGDYAREYVRSLNFEGSPGTLVHHQEGHVIDTDGVDITSPVGNPLRALSKWYNTTGSGAVSHQIDEAGNVWWKLPTSADIGWATDIPKGTFRITTGRKIQLSAKTNIDIASSGNMTLSARGVLSIVGGLTLNLSSSGAITITAPNVTIKGRIVQDLPTPI